MAKHQPTIPFVPKPTTKTHYDRAPKPRTPRTPRAEYAFMRSYSLLLTQRTGSFGPVGGSVIQ